MDLSTGFTDLLARAKHGDAAAAERAIMLLHSELHAIAAGYMRRERSSHTLQPTALVNEAFLRLPSGLETVRDRHHFFALAAQAMRHVLVDHARRRRANKRGGHAVRVTLSAVGGAESIDIDVLALDDSLTALAAIDERAARVVELRFFCGYTDKEVAEALGLGVATVRRDWEFARAWLRKRLRP
jgi:RNA polymerase sigma factor (TIGR02999 family)